MLLLKNIVLSFSNYLQKEQQKIHIFQNNMLSSTQLKPKSTKKLNRKRERKKEKGRNLRESNQLTSETLQSFRHIHGEKTLDLAHPLL